MKHPKENLILFLHKKNNFKKLFFLLFLFFSNRSLAIESSSNRESIVSARTKRFYKENRSKQYLSLGGIYSSDYNSKNYTLNSRYLYQSYQSIYEANFDCENNYADSGSGSTKKYNVKKSELYDLSLSGKKRIGESKNYLVAFDRIIYDDLSQYYYDNRIAGGIGRMFFGDRLEIDASIGYRDVKSYGYLVDFIPSWRANFKINDKITFLQRGYFFLDHESLDNHIKTSLVYRIGNSLSFEIRHNFEKRRYEDDENRVNVNRVNRSITIGLIFDLN